MASTLQSLRKAKGFKSAKDFAEALSIPLSTYARYEQTPNKIPLSSAWTIADYLECSIDEVVGHTTPEPSSESSELQQIYNELSPQNQNLMDEFLEFLKTKEKKDQLGLYQVHRSRIEKLTRHYHRLFLEELENDTTFTDVLGFSTPEEERDAFKKFIERTATKKRAKELTLGGLSNDAEKRKELKERDKAVIKEIMKVYDQHFKNAIHAWVSLD